MTGSDDAAVHRTLGQLLEAVKRLGDDMHNMRSDMHRSEQKSDESRAVLHRRVDTLVERVGGVESKMSETQSDISEMKPVTDDVKKWKLMGMGALGVVGVGGVALGVTLAGFFDQAVKLIRATG